MKKRYLSIISILSLILLISISKITNISLENTWLGTIGVILIFAPLIIMAWSQAKKIKKQKPILSIIIKFISIIFIMTAIVNVVYWIVNYIDK